MNYKTQLVEYKTADYYATVDLRNLILRKPLGLYFNPDEHNESPDYHVATYQNNILIGCLMLTPIDAKTLKMRQVSVLDTMQGKGVGKEMVHFSEQFAKEKNFELMVLNARETAVKFYLGLNYIVVGEPFIEVTLPHRKMQKILF